MHLISAMNAKAIDETVLIEDVPADNKSNEFNSNNNNKTVLNSNDQT